MRRFEYTVLLKPAKEGGFVVTCRDLLEVITQGEDTEDAFSGCGCDGRSLCGEDAGERRFSNTDPSAERGAPHLSPGQDGREGRALGGHARGGCQ